MFFLSYALLTVQILGLESCADTMVGMKCEEVSLVDKESE